MLPGDFLVAKLTGEFQTTITGLSEGIFWDFKNDTPSDRLFDYYHILGLISTITYLIVMSHHKV